MSIYHLGMGALSEVYNSIEWSVRTYGTINGNDGNDDYNKVVNVAFTTICFGVLMGGTLVATRSLYRFRTLNMSIDALSNHVKNLKSENPNDMAVALENILRLLTALDKNRLKTTYLPILAKEIPHLIYILENNPDLIVQTHALQILTCFILNQEGMLEEKDFEKIISIISQKLTESNHKLEDGSIDKESLNTFLLRILDLLNKMDTSSSANINSGCLSAMNALIKNKEKVLSKEVVSCIAHYYLSRNWDPELILDAKTIPDVIQILFNLMRGQHIGVEANGQFRSALFFLTSEKKYKNEIIAHSDFIRNFQHILKSDLLPISNVNELRVIFLCIAKLKLGETHPEVLDESMLRSLAKIIRRDDLELSGLACHALSSLLPVKGESELEKPGIMESVHKHNIFPMLPTLLTSFGKFAVSNGVSRIDRAFALTYEMDVMELIEKFMINSNITQKIKLLGMNEGILSTLCRAFQLKINDSDFSGIILNQGIIDPKKPALFRLHFLANTLLLLIDPSDLDTNDSLAEPAQKKYKTKLNEKLYELWSSLPLMLEVKQFGSDFCGFTSALIVKALLIKNEEIIASILESADTTIELMRNNTPIELIRSDTPIENYVSTLHFIALLKIGVELKFTKNPLLPQKFIDSKLLPSLAKSFEFLITHSNDELGIITLLSLAQNTLISLYEKCSSKAQAKMLAVLKEFPHALLVLEPIFQSSQVSVEVKETLQDNEKNIESKNKGKEQEESKATGVPATGNKDKKQLIKKKKEKEKTVTKTVNAPSPSKGKRPANQNLFSDFEDMLFDDTADEMPKASEAQMNQITPVEEKRTIIYLDRMHRWTNAVPDNVRHFIDYINPSTPPIRRYLNYSDEKIVEQIQDHTVFGILEELYTDELKNKYYIVKEKGPSFLAQSITYSGDSVKHRVGFVNFGIDKIDETNNNVNTVYHGKFDPLNPEKRPTILVENGNEYYEEEIILPFDLDRASLDCKPWTPVGNYTIEKLKNGCMQFTYRDHILRIFPLRYGEDRKPFSQASI